MNLKKITKAALAGLLATALAAGLAGCGKSGADSAKSADGKKIVTVAHTNYYVPYDYVNEQGGIRRLRSCRHEGSGKEAAAV